MAQQNMTKVFIYLTAFGLTGVVFMRLLLTHVSLSLEHRQGHASERILTKDHRYHGKIQWIFGSGPTFLDRLGEYGEALSKERQVRISMQDHTNDSFHWLHTNKTAHVVGTKQFIETLYQLENVSQVSTIALAWLDGNTKEDYAHLFARNVLVQDYYRAAEAEQMCSSILERTKSWRAGTLAKNRPKTCPANQTAPVKAESIRTHVLNPYRISRSAQVQSGGLFNQSVEMDPAPLPHVFFVHVIQDGVVDAQGDVFTEDVKIIPSGCNNMYRYAQKIDKKSSLRAPLYEEVFVISQFWSSTVFHKMCESLPRLAPYVEFLKANPGIKIHAVETRGLTMRTLTLLGLLGTGRLVSGLTRGSTVYLPQGSPCGTTNVHLVQLISHKYRTSLRSTYPPDSLQRNSIVMIKRTRNRMFKQASQIETTVKAMAEKNGFRYELFSDNPMPQFEQIAQMFNRAVIVVAPHGAGLSNIQFSEPGTYVIEVTCNPPNICFEHMSYCLGHRYHGLIVNGGCEEGMDIAPETITNALQIYIDRLKSSSHN